MRKFKKIYSASLTISFSHLYINNSFSIRVDQDRIRTPVSMLGSVICRHAKFDHMSPC